MRGLFGLVRYPSCPGLYILSSCLCFLGAGKAHVKTTYTSFADGSYLKDSVYQFVRK